MASKGFLVLGLKVGRKWYRSKS